MILSVDTTKTGGTGTAATHFKLPLTVAGVYNFSVDWGDGQSDTITAWNDAAVDHTYAAGGVYTVTILGQCTVWSFNNAGDKLKVLRVLNWGEAVTSTLDFYGCTNLVSVTGSATDYPRVATFSNIFRDCTALAGAFPPMNTSAVTNFGNAWFSCSSLTSFPLLDTSKGTTLSYAWYGCTGLTSFPAINTALAVSVNGAWSACSGLTSFPMLPDTDHTTDWTSTWQGCTGLAGFAFPALDMRGMTTGSSCFSGWAMLTAAYDAILNQLANGDGGSIPANVTTNTVFSGGNSKYTAAAVAARATLTTTRTWTITDGGL